MDSVFYVNSEFFQTGHRLWDRVSDRHPLIGGQAYMRGVKIIGATAHYVTTELDEGPIIEQAVERIDHNFDIEELMQIGRDAECAAFARAVKWHCEHRIIVNGNKTVVFK